MPTSRNWFVRRAPPTATLSRRRTNWSVLPSPTDKHGSFGSDGGFRDAFNPEPSLKKRNYLLVHAKLPTLGKRFSLAETFFPAQHEGEVEEEEDEEVEEEEEEDEGKVVYFIQGYDKMHAFNDGILPTLFEKHDNNQLHITEI